MRKQKKLGLSLRGGGAGTESYLGVLKALDENGIKVDYIVGSSAGALIAAAYAASIPLDRIINHCRGFTAKKYIGIHSLKNLSINSVEKSLKYGEELFGDMNIEDTQIKLWIQATNLDTLKTDYLEYGDLLTAIAASSALPIWSKPIEFEGQKYVDGDFSSGYGAGFLREKGAEVVIGLGVKLVPSLNHRKLTSRLIEPVSIAIHKVRELDAKVNPVDIIIDDLAAGIKTLDFCGGVETIDEAYEKTMQRMPEIKAKLFGQSLWDRIKSLF